MVRTQDAQREKKSAQASAEGWAAEVARAEELYEELRERAPQHCRRGGKWAREKFVMAVQEEFPRARGAGVPKGTILCLGRVLDAHDEQDDAEGGRRDWEEDPLGFDTPTRGCSAPCAWRSSERRAGSPCLLVYHLLPRLYRVLCPRVHFIK